MEDLSKHPALIDRDNSHVISYDIEAEFKGNSYSSFKSPMLCISIACSCGYKAVVSKTKLQRRVVICYRRRMEGEETANYQLTCPADATKVLVRYYPKKKWSRTIALKGICISKFLQQNIVLINQCSFYYKMQHTTSCSKQSRR
jgi:hypothetical protein